jgi:hypothetical protein
LASVFWGKDGILLVDCLEKGAAIMAMYCCTCWQTEAETGLEPSRQAFKRKLITSRQ